MSGYSDGTFRPDQAVTLEEGCSAVLNLLGYDVTALSGSFPTAQLNKASQLGLLADLSCSRGENMTLEDGAVLLYNALMAENGGKRGLCQHPGLYRHRRTGGRVRRAAGQSGRPLRGGGEHPAAL